MRDLRIVFMGTPEFAVSSLAAIREAGFNVVGVITAPDRPAGRGRKLRASAVKEYAVSENIPVLQPTNLKSKEFLNDLRALNPNVQVVVAFRMLPESVWKLPEYGTFNLHASLLPDYRGAAPINWAVINGEAETGVTTFFIDEKIDTGNIILQEKTRIAPEETAGELHDRLMVLGASLVVETLRRIQSSTITTIPQKHITSIRQAPKIDRETCRINWENTMEEVHNKIRGMSPYPAAWTTLLMNGEETELKILRATTLKSKHDDLAGSISIIENSIGVAVRGGYILLQEVKPAGKRNMEVKAWLNGLTLTENARFL